MENQVIIFTLETENYGFPIETVQEIIRISTITRVPHTPVFLRGVINLRGNVIPVIDLKQRLNLGAAKLTESSRIIVVSHGGLVGGFIVDSVTEVVTIDSKDIEEPPAEISREKGRHISGIAKFDNSLAVLLDSVSLFSFQKTMVG